MVTQTTTVVVDGDTIQVRTQDGVTTILINGAQPTPQWLAEHYQGGVLRVKGIVIGQVVR